MSDDAGEPWEDKLADGELRRLGRAETASVIVELELPRPQVELGRSELAGAPRPRRVELEPDGRRASSEELVEQARTFLEQLLGRAPVWLSAPRAFGAEASGEQLREIARSPLVRRLHLSRLRR